MRSAARPWNSLRFSIGSSRSGPRVPPISWAWTRPNQNSRIEVAAPLIEAVDVYKSDGYTRRNANFSDVLKKISEIAPKHKCFKRNLGKRGESEFRYIFSHPDDSNRELVLTVLAFDVPTEEHRSKSGS
jgi:hypothetical protein